MRVAHVLDLHPAHHLANDGLDVLVVDVDALQAVNLLNRVDQVSLRVFFAEHGQQVVRVERPVNQRLAGLDVLAFLHVDVHAAGDGVFLLRLAVFAFDVDLAQALADFAVLHHAVDFADDGGILGLARFEQFDDARQTAGDVLGLGGFARNLREHVARLHLVAVRDHQVRARRHQVLLARCVPAESRIRIVGWCFSSPGGSVTTTCDRPVTSSTCSSMVMPGCRSLNWMVPPTSVRIENVNGSHSARIWPSVTGWPSSTRRRAP